MATIVGTVLGSSVFNGSNGKHFTLKLSYELVQDKINNKSTITYRLYVVTSQYGSGYGSRVPGYINGVDVGGVTSLSGNTTTLVGTKVEKDITHNPDGTKSVSYSASMGGVWTGLGYASISGTLTLPKIPRQANIKKANDFNDEGNPYLEFDNPANFTLKLVLRIYKATNNDYYEVEYTGEKTSPINWSLTDAQRTTMRNYCNDGVKGKVVYVLTTYSDSSMTTQVGSVSEYVASWNIVSANPTVALISEEANEKVKAVVGNNKIALNYLSQIKATATVDLKKGATLKVIEVNGVPNSTSPFTPIINVAQANGGNLFILKATATDSRGNVSSEVLDTYTLVDYRPVSIDSRHFARENATSSEILLNAEITYWNSKLNNVDNSLAISYSTDGNSFTPIPSSEYIIDNDAHKVSINDYILPTTLDYRQQGTFYLKVVDKYTEDNENEIVTVGIPTMEKGKRVVQVNGDLIIADENGENAINVKEMSGGLEIVRWEGV